MENVGDNSNITDSEIFRMRNRLLPLLPSDYAFGEIQSVSDKFAKVTGLYVQGLEARVGRLESHVRELLIQMGCRKRDKDAE